MQKQQKMMPMIGRQWAIPLIYLLASMVNISWAGLGLLCIAAPVALLYWRKKPVYCQGACPRINLYEQVQRTFKAGKKRQPPKWLVASRVREGFFFYFLMNMTIIIVTTLMVASGKIEPIMQVRFALAVPVPWLAVTEAFGPDWWIHLSYRLASMIVTTTLIGGVFTILFQPRTWCRVCPITTVNMNYNHSQKQRKR